MALIDPDFIFLKPLTTWMNPKEAVARGDGLSLEGLKLEKGGWVRKGYPAGGAPFELYTKIYLLSCWVLSCVLVFFLLWREERTRTQCPQRWRADDVK